MKHRADVTDRTRLWTHEMVERRLQDAMTTLRRLPMPKDGLPPRGHSAWPEYPHDATDRAGWIIGADTPEYLRRNEADQNRTRLNASKRQIRDMEECLDWLLMLRDGRQRKVVFARSHVWPESERPMYSYRKIARELRTSHEKARYLYRTGIRDIAMALSATTTFDKMAGF